MHRHSIYLLVLAAILAISACDQEHSAVTISQPEVFTRERLVDERLRDTQYLVGKLATEPTFPVEGLEDERVFNSFSEALSLQFNPGGIPGTSGSGSSGSSASTTKPSAGSAASTQPSPSEAGLSKTQVSPFDNLKDQLAYRDAVDAAIRQRELDDTHDLHGFTLYSLKFNLSVLPSSGSKHYLVVLLEAKGQLKPKDPVAQKDEDESLYQAWLHSLNDELQLETEQCLKRLLLDQLPESQLHLILGEFHQQLVNQPASPVSEFTADEAMAAFEDFIFRSRAQRTNLFKSNNPTDLSELKYVAATAIIDKYKQQLKEYANFKPLSPLPSTQPTQPIPNYFFITEIDESDHGRLPKFRDKLKLLERFNRPRELSVEPQELAQDISDVSSRQDVIDLALTLGAAFHQIDLSSATSNLSQSEVLLQTIRRQPLVVGFGDGRQRFGWILGPKFLIGDKNKPDFGYTPVTQSVTAELAIPAWWSNIVLESHCYWMDDDGTLTPARQGSDLFELPEEKSADNSPAVPYQLESVNEAGYSSSSDWTPSVDKMVVDLPCDIPAITTALLYENNRVQRKPEIQPTWHAEDPNPAPPYCLQAQAAGSAAEQTLLIQGRDLWRNPKVFVGSLQADTVDVLPDMDGLLAHFKTVPMPAQATPGNLIEDLTVVTSFGYDMIPRAVTILPPPKPLAQGSYNLFLRVEGANGSSLDIPVTGSVQPSP